MAANRDYWDAEQGIYTTGFNPDQAIENTHRPLALGPKRSDHAVVVRLSAQQHQHLTTTLCC